MIQGLTDDPRRDDLRWSQTQMIPNDPRWSQMVPDNPRWSQDDRRWSQMTPGDPRWYQMISDQMISEDLRRNDFWWFQIHMVPDDPNAIWGLTLESSTSAKSIRTYVRSFWREQFILLSLKMDRQTPVDRPQTRTFPGSLTSGLFLANICETPTV